MKEIEKEVVIKATPEEVWRAISEAEGLKRWFTLDARVSPGPGGSVMMSFGEGAEWETPIEVWEPNRHLRTAADMGPQKIAVDYYIEARGGETVLRLVHSGFADDTWDDELETMGSGWASFLANLRHYLERHPDQPRTMAFYRHPVVELDRETAYGKVMDALHMRRDGKRYMSDLFRGEISIDRPPIHFAGTAENWDDGWLMVEIEPGRDRCRPAIWVSLYGEEQAKAPELQERIKRLLDDAFAGVARPTTAANT